MIQLGTGTTVSVRQLFDLLARIVGRDATIVSDPARERPARSEVMVLQSDPSYAYEWLAWRATTPLEDGLRLTVRWFEQQGLHDPGFLQL